jgi:flagellar basal-body rod protein FlgB
MSLVTDTTNRALQSGMDLRLRRQEMLSTNLANMDTPNYQPKDLEFEGTLQKIRHNDLSQVDMGMTDGSHMVMGHPIYNGDDEVIERPDVLNSVDGNGVDLDQEMARFADNSTRYNANVEMMRRRVGILNYTIMKMGEPG